MTAKRTVEHRFRCDQPSGWSIGFARVDDGPLLLSLYYGDKEYPTHTATVTIPQLRELLSDLGLE